MIIITIIIIIISTTIIGPYDEELERQIRLLLISSYDPVEVKTTCHYIYILHHHNQYYF